MSQIIDLIGCQKQSGDIGVEIEVEADNLPHPSLVDYYWRTERDNSLRGNSAEYVLRKPETLRGVENALKLLEREFEKANTQVRPTYRAGIHIHVNVQDLTPKQLITYIASYLMLEEVLVRYCDNSRLGNHFCLRMSDASYFMDVMTDVITRGDLAVFNTEDIRYASINVTSLFKYGSIEFRALESTFDRDKILNWAGALKQLKDFSKTIQIPTDLLGQASMDGFESYARLMLGNYAAVYVPYITRQNVEIGVRNIQHPLFSRVWDRPDLNIFDKKSIFSTP